MAPTTVVPMPWYSRERVERSKIWRLATRMPVSRRFSSSLRFVSKWNGQVTSSLAVVRKNSEIVSVAMRRRHVPGAVPAHAVGDDEQVVLVEHDEGVLVVLALEPDVAQPGRDCTHQGADSSNRVRAFHPPM